MVSGKLLAKYSSQRICRDSEWQDLIVSVRVSIASNRVIARKRRGCFGGMRSDDEKDGSDPILTRRHFAERLDGTGKM